MATQDNQIMASKRIRSDVKKLQGWLDEQEVSCGRAVQDILPDELDQYLAQFLGSVKTRNGDPYDPDSLHTLRSNINRFLKSSNYPCCLTKSREFHRSQAVLKNRRLELKNEAKLRAVELTVALKSNVLGIKNPLALVESMFCVNSLYFGVFLRTKSDHCCLRWGDVELQVDAQGQEVLVLTGNASRLVGGKHRLSRLPNNHSVRAAANPSNPSLCPILVYKEYQRRRSITSSCPETRFYLMPTPDKSSEIWFHESACVDIQNLGTFVRDIKNKISFLPHNLLEEKP